MEFITSSLSFDLSALLVDLVRIGAAFALAIPIGWERHRSQRNLGLRTFPIVAIGACGYVLLFKSFPGATVETHSRLIQGLIGGIGFIGGGAILKHGTNVQGLATAASIWCTGAIGVAVAFERTEIAVILSLIIFLTLRVLSPLAEGTDGDTADGGDGNEVGGNTQQNG